MKKKLEYYKYKNLKDDYERLVSRIANVRIIMFVVMIISFILKYYYYKFLFNIVFFVSLISFFVLVLAHNKYFKMYDYYSKYLVVLDNYLARENGNWKKFNDKGNDFINSSSQYLSDLDIVGDCSLFQYLSVCKTLGGREKLIEKLLNIEVVKTEFYHIQELVEELIKDIDFCIKFQVLMGYYEGKDIYLSKNFDGFNKAIDIGKDFFIAIITSIICISLFILACLNILPFIYFYGMFLFNVAISSFYVYIYKEEFIKLDKMINYYSKLSDVFELIGNYSGSSYKMKRIVRNVKNSLVSMVKLRELDGFNSLRNNLLSNFLFNGVCCLNLFVRVNYSLFVDKYFECLEISFRDIEELEAMISLATIGIVKNDICMPMLNDEIGLEFSELKHPLIDEKVCISNSFDGKAGINIITGSNMGGKTTFLRTIGINLILMQAGTYVCGEHMTASYFKIFTSMRVMDNMDKGISTFYGELLRIKDMIDYNGKGNMLVLIDEIFKGTNYSDRMYGAKEVVRKLNNKHNIAFITTHDFELCESSRVKNFHVKEDYEGDRIVFDYKIREGKCTSTNARYLMEKLDIIEKV